MYAQLETQDQIDAYRDQARKEYGHLGFEINSNRRGIHARCTTCHVACTRETEMWMLYRHTECREAKARKLYALSTPNLNGDVVTQGHKDYCKSNGHMTYKVGDVDQGICPRCGDRY